MGCLAVHEGSYFTYIMASRSHTLCIGVTTPFPAASQFECFCVLIPPIRYSEFIPENRTRLGGLACVRPWFALCANGCLDSLP